MCTTELCGVAGEERWSLLFIWSVSFVWLNQIDQTDQMNQINPRPFRAVLLQGVFPSCPRRQALELRFCLV